MRSRYHVLLITLLAALATAASADPAPSVRTAVARSVALMEKSLAEYPRHNACFSCHHQGVAAVALGLARARGYAIGDVALPALAKHTEADLRSDLASYKAGKGQPGGVTRAGYALLALDWSGSASDEVTAAVAGFLLQRDLDRGAWHSGSNRPPAEHSDFTDTFLAIHALNRYGQREGNETVAARIDRARKWLEETEAKETEDRVFQLWGLKEAGASAASLGRAAKDLLAQQQPDGGWAQLPGGSSDAYATGSAMTALLLAGRLAPGDAACKRAIAYLLARQEKDGSWHVTSRSKPFQPYFESGFPHGRDQFISMAATGWATAALVLSGGSAAH